MFQKENMRYWPIIGLISIPFFIAVAIMDYFFPFAEDINVLLPESLLFYPVMGFIAEMIFHVAPLLLFYGGITALFKRVDRKTILIVIIIVVSMIEAVFQFVFDTSTTRPIWIKGIDALRLFLFAMVQPLDL